MAGGIFVDQPYHPNPKCLLFSAIIMALYWFSPAKKNNFLLPVIFTISYVAMAWYDYKYHCDTKMYSGSKSLGGNSIFKPQRRNETPDEGKKLLPNQEQEYLKRVYLFHLIAVAPLLIYVGYKGNKVNPKFFPVVLSAGVMAGVYHGIHIFKPRQTANM